MTQVNPDLQAKQIQASSLLNRKNIKVADILQPFSPHLVQAFLGILKLEYVCIFKWACSD